MARYDYRCDECDETFEVRRPMASADDTTTCPAGHRSVRRLLSVFAVTGTSGGTADRPAPMPALGCGGACACASASASAT